MSKETKALQAIFVSSLFGKQSKEGLVELVWGEKTIQMSIEEARSIAFNFLEAAEAAETDQMCYEFGKDAGDAMAGVALMNFMRHRREQRRAEYPRQ